MRAIGRACDKVVTNHDVPARERVVTRAKTSRRDGVRDEDAALDTRSPQVVLQSEEVHMHAVRDEAEPKPIAQCQRPLDDVVMPVHLHGATVAHMREHADAIVRRGLQRVVARIAMPRRDHDPLPCEPSSGLESIVALGGQGHQLGQALSRIDQTLRILHRARLDALRRMRPHVALLAIDERPFNVDARDDFLGQRIPFPQVRQGLHAKPQILNCIGDEGRKNLRAPVRSQALAGMVQSLSREAIAIEVSASVAVYLQVEGRHGCGGENSPTACLR